MSGVRVSSSPPCEKPRYDGVFLTRNGASTRIAGAPVRHRRAREGKYFPRRTTAAMRSDNISSQPKRLAKVSLSEPALLLDQRDIPATVASINESRFEIVRAV